MAQRTFAVLLAVVLMTVTVQAATVCPDGKFHGSGTCKKCPDGTYVTAPLCSLAPDGTWGSDYGRGRRLAPDGRYIPETGSFVMCPDGHAYPGKRCKLMPDGHYLGSS